MATKTKDFDFSEICTEPFYGVKGDGSIETKRQRIRDKFFTEAAKLTAETRRRLAKGPLSLEKAIKLLNRYVDALPRACFHIIEYTQPKTQPQDDDHQTRAALKIARAAERPATGPQLPLLPGNSELVELLEELVALHWVKMGTMDEEARSGFLGALRVTVKQRRLERNASKNDGG